MCVCVVSAGRSPDLWASCALRRSCRTIIQQMAKATKVEHAGRFWLSRGVSLSAKNTHCFEYVIFVEEVVSVKFNCKRIIYKCCHLLCFECHAGLYIFIQCIAYIWSDTNKQKMISYFRRVTINNKYIIMYKFVFRICVLYLLFGFDSICT